MTDPSHAKGAFRLAAAILGLGLGAVGLAWAVRGVALGDLVAAWKELPAWIFGPALLCEFGVQAAKAAKWRELLRAVRPISFQDALLAVIAGAASTHLLPLRLDEFVRAAVLSRRTGIPAAAVLGTVAVDRIVEICVVALILTTAGVSGGVPGWMGAATGALGAVAVLGMALLILSRRLRGEPPQIAAFPGLSSRLAELAAGLTALPRGLSGLRFFTATAVEWGCTALMYALFLGTFHPGTPPSLPWLLALGNVVAYAIPNVPGAVGTYESVMCSLLEEVGGLPATDALLFALLAHAVIAVPVTLLGAIVLLGLGRDRWKGL